MSKKRSFPFGYQMVDGKIHICPEEAILVRLLFKEYLEGIKTPVLAQRATLTGPPYRKDTKAWNKNMVCRILDNRKYLGTDQYPQIVGTELFRQVEAQRSAIQTGRLNPILKDVREKICCAHCGQKLARSNRHSYKNVIWICPSCKMETIAISDSELIEKIVIALNYTITNPEQMWFQPKDTKKISLEAIRLTHEIDRGIKNLRTDSNRLLELIKTCAQEKYKAYSSSATQWENHHLKKLLDLAVPLTSLDTSLFGQAVFKVLITRQATVSLELINRTIV